MTDGEMCELERWTGGLMRRARAHGLDFYEMHFEVCPADVIYTFGAYGMPTRFSHWSFGKAFHRMKTEYDFNLSRIYELVVNSDPCYAFLLDGNTLLQNKLVIAHVLAHSDFFKNNYRFRSTSRFMMENMAAHARRIADYEFRYGKEVVEEFLDAALAVAEQVDPHPIGPPSEGDPSRDSSAREPGEAASAPSSAYDDLWELDAHLASGKPRESPQREKRRASERARAARRCPARPEKDVVHFILEHSGYLEEWERDVLAMIREEALYFWPQIETKIMNEGWASYWHLRLMREEDLDEADAIEFARMHAGVIGGHRFHLNPYLLGLKVFEAIEERWDAPSDEDRARLGIRGGQGREKIFEVRETQTDASFIRDHLTREVVEELKLFTFARREDRWEVESTTWEAVRDTLAQRLVNGGIPSIVVEDGDHKGTGELLLRHQYEGQELDLEHLEKVLPYVHRLWGRPVHLLTRVDGRETTFSCDGERVRRSASG